MSDPVRGRAAQAMLIAVVTVAAALPAGAAAKAPGRVVALTPFTASTLAELGVKPIAIGRTLGGEERYPRSLRKVRRLTLSHPNGPNLEQLATLNPGLVFSSPTWRKGHAAMRALQMKVAVSDPRSVAGLARETRRIGRLVGRGNASSRVAERLRGQIARATRRIRKRPRVLMVLGVGRTPFAFLPNSWGGDLVRRAGGRLLTTGLKDGGGFAKVSDEIVLERNPDVIIAVPHASEDDIPAITEFLKDNPGWRGTNAVRNNRVYVSVDNSLLQAGTDVAATIRKVRKRYLRNLR